MEGELHFRVEGSRLGGAVKTGVGSPGGVELEGGLFPREGDLQGAATQEGGSVSREGDAPAEETLREGSLWREGFSLEGGYI